jgi:hypothetical protein
MESANVRGTCIDSMSPITSSEFFYAFAMNAFVFSVRSLRSFAAKSVRFIESQATCAVTQK